MWYFSSFKLFLELDPQVRDVLHKFYESQYATCLKILDEIKVDNMLYESQYATCLKILFKVDNMLYVMNCCPFVLLFIVWFVHFFPHDDDDDDDDDDDSDNVDGDDDDNDNNKLYLFMVAYYNNRE